MRNPTVGRLGKARRRKQVRKHCKAENINNDENTEDLSSEIDKRMRLNGNGTREDFLEFCRAAFERLSVESVAENSVEEIWREIVATLKSHYDGFKNGFDGVERQ